MGIASFHPSCKLPRLTPSDLILRRREAPSRRMNGNSRATWFETALSRLLTMRVESELVLPAADAAGCARPFLDAGVARLRIERIGMTPRQLGAGGRARLLDAPLRHMSCDVSCCCVRLGRGFLRHNHALRLHRPGIVSGLDPDGGEMRLRAEPLRREHGLRKIEADELAGLVVACQRGAAR